MLGRFRKGYEEKTLGLGRFFASLGLTPNALTILSLIASIFSFYFFYEKNLLMGFIFILVMALFDMLDGAVARATGKITKFGGVLDHVIDRYAEFFIILGLILGDYLNWLIGFFALFGMLMASYVRGKAESIGGLKSCTVGIAERQEKLILIMAGVIFFNYNENFLNLLVLIVGVLSHITVAQRLDFARKNIK